MALAQAPPLTPLYPTSIPADSDMALAANFAEDTLASTVDAVTLAIPLNSASEFTTSGIVRIDSEFIRYCSKTSNTLNVCTDGRGLDQGNGGGVPAPHASGVRVRDVVMAHHHNRTIAELRAGLTELGSTGSFNFFDIRSDQNIGLHFVDVQQISVPANPASGTRRLFTNTVTGELSVLTSAGATVSLEGASHDILSITHTDTLAAAVVRGDIMIGNTTPAWSRLAVGGAATFLRSDGTDPAYSSILVGDLPAHATTHQNAGSDEVATATPGANAIPKAGASGDLAEGWIPASLSQDYAFTGANTSKHLNHVHYAPDFDFSQATQSPSDDLAGGSDTINLAPCPEGVNGTNDNYAVWIDDADDSPADEFVLVTGGTCTSGASSGTITITTASAFTGGDYNVRSSTAGIEEAMWALLDGGNQDGGVISIPPGIHNLRSTLDLGNGTAALLSGGGVISDINHFALQGAGRGAANTAAESGPYTTLLKWLGPSSDSVVVVRGNVVDLRVRNMKITGNDASGDVMVLRSCAACVFENLVVGRGGANSVGIDVHTGTSQTLFKNVQIAQNNAAGNAGIRFGEGDTALGISQNILERVDVSYAGDGLDADGFYFEGADNNSCYQCNALPVIVNVTDCTNASPIVVTTSISHGRATGAQVTIRGVLGNTACNVIDNAITDLTATTFSLDGTTGNGTYSGGPYTLRGPGSSLEFNQSATTAIFPMENGFFNSSFQRDVVKCTGSHGPNFFFSFPTSDGELIQCDTDGGFGGASQVSGFAHPEYSEGTQDYYSRLIGQWKFASNDSFSVAGYAKFYPATSEVAIGNRVDAVSNPGGTLAIEQTGADGTLLIATTTSGDGIVRFLNNGNQEYRLTADRGGNTFKMERVGTASFLEFFPALEDLHLTGDDIVMNAGDTPAETWRFRNDSSLDSVGLTFASLGTAAGSQIYCTDCQVTSSTDNTCASGGSGAWAFRLNGAWECFDADAGAGGTGGTSHDILSATHTDTTTAAVVRGDLMIGNVTPAWDRLAAGGVETYLRSDGTDPAWSLITLGTNTAGNYAAGDGEAGAALTGDSATAFFSSGTLAADVGGTGAGAFTLGSVVFVGASGSYQQNNAEFFFETGTGELGIGSATPDEDLHISEATDGDSVLLLLENSQAADAGTNETAQVRFGFGGNNDVARIITSKLSDYQSAANEDSRISIHADFGGTSTEIVRFQPASATNGIPMVHVPSANDGFAFLGAGLDPLTDCAVTFFYDGGTSQGQGGLNVRPCAGGTPEFLFLANNNEVFRITDGVSTWAAATTIDASAATSLEVPNSANPITDAFGELAADNDAWAASRGSLEHFDGTASTFVVATLASDVPTNLQVPKWNTGGTITWEDDISGGSPAWDTIAVPGANQILAMDVDTTTFNWTTTADALLDAWTMTHTNTSGTDTTAQTLLRLQSLNNAAAGSLNRFLEIDHGDGGTADVGVLISETGAGTITAGISITGTVTTGIDLSDAGIVTGLALGANNLTTTGIGTSIVDADLAIIDDSTITLTTETTGNYAAGDGEAGASLTGDSATAFFAAGELEVARGGSGVATITGLIQGNGAADFTAIADSSTVGEVLRVTGASAYAWGTLDLADGDAVTGLLDESNLDANVVLDNAANTYGSFAQSFAAASMVLPVSAAAAPTANGAIAYDSTASQLEYGDNTVNRVVANLDEAQSLSAKTLVTPTIVATGWTNAQHAHAAANSGGQIPIGNTTGDLSASRVDDGGVASTQALFSGAGGAAGFRAIADGDVPDTITANLYLLLAGGTMTGNVDWNDGSGDSPQAIFTPQTGTAFQFFADDTGDDLRITAATSSTENVEFENTGTGVMDVFVETTNGVLTSVQDGAVLTTGTVPAARVGADHLDAVSEIAAGIKRGPDATDTHLLTTDVVAPAGIRCLQMDTDGSTILATDTCANLGPGGTPSLDAVTDPVATKTFTFDATGENLVWSYTSAFGAGIKFGVEQITGNPTAGSLVDFRAADANVTVLRAGDGTNGITLSQAGALTAEGTGTITATNMTIAKYAYFRAAGCQNTTAATGFDLPTATTPAANCAASFDTDKTRGTLDFDDGAVVDEDITGTFSLLPGHTGNIDLFGYWHGTATVNEARWCVQIQCVDSGETPGAYNTASCVDDTANGTADRFNDFSLNNITQTGCSANDELFFRFYRDSNDAGDDFSGDAKLVSIRFTFRDAQAQ